MAHLIRQGIDCRHGSRLLAGADGPGNLVEAGTIDSFSFSWTLFFFLPG